jgi:hypothetical protein
MVVVRDGVSVFLAVMGVERGFGGVAEISPTERLDLEREREDLKLGKDQDSWGERMQRVEKGVSRGHNASSHEGTLEASCRTTSTRAHLCWSQSLTSHNTNHV